jgi:hypothetical protein
VYTQQQNYRYLNVYILLKKVPALSRPVPGSLDKKEGRRFHLLWSKRCHLLRPLLSNEPGSSCRHVADLDISRVRRSMDINTKKIKSDYIIEKKIRTYEWKLFICIFAGYPTIFSIRLSDFKKAILIRASLILTLCGQNKIPKKASNLFKTLPVWGKQWSLD